MERIELPRTLAVQLLTHAQSSPDREICGLVAARNGEPDRAIRISNASPQPKRLFEMDDAELVAAMKSMRAAGETLFAIYHSHPGSAPRPSLADLERAGHPEALHLIISLGTKGVLEMQGWRITGNTASPVEIGIRES